MAYLEKQEGDQESNDRRSAEMRQNGMERAPVAADRGELAGSEPS